MIAIAVCNGWDLDTTDVSTSYLNAPMDKPVWMHPPRGVKDPLDRGRIMCVLSSLYGLKVSAKNWHWTFTIKIKAFANHLGGVTLEIVTSDECMFKFERGGDVLVILIVVDDILSATNNQSFRQEFLAFLRQDFIVTDDGKLTFFLGVGYDWLEDGSLVASQTAYIDQFTKRFKLETSKPSSIPMESNFSVDESDLDANPDPKHLAWYQAAVGCCMYAMIWTKPESCY
eukprot:2978977-Rhodomonas_salina.1